MTKVKNLLFYLYRVCTSWKIELLYSRLFTQVFKAATHIPCPPQIQIGCQTDTLEHKELKRAAIVCEQFPITAEKMEVWNLWGGLIYLVAPPNTKVEGAEIIVQKAIRAPYYKSGKCVCVAICSCSAEELCGECNAHHAAVMYQLFLAN